MRFPKIVLGNQHLRNTFRALFEFISKLTWFTPVCLSDQSPCSKTLSHVTKSLNESSFLTLDAVFRAPAGVVRLQVFFVHVVVDAGILGQVGLAPKTTDVVQARCHNHIGNGTPYANNNILIYNSFRLKCKIVLFIIIIRSPKHNK